MFALFTPIFTFDYRHWAILDFISQRVSMDKQRIVIHYLDGRVLKGHTVNFNPSAPHFLLTPLDGEADKPPIVVELVNLKAIFFVKDFIGRRSYNEKKAFSAGLPYQGKKLRLTFRDSEVMYGSSPNYDAKALGFFFFPADPNANTIRMFVVNSALGLAQCM